MLSRRSMLGTIGALSAGVAFGDYQGATSESSPEGRLGKLFEDMRALIPVVDGMHDSLLSKDQASRRLAGVVFNRFGLSGAHYGKRSHVQRCPANTVADDQYVRVVCFGGVVFFTVSVADRNFGFKSAQIIVSSGCLAGKSQLGDSILGLHECVHGSILANQCSSDLRRIEQVRRAFEDYLSVKIGDNGLPYCGYYRREGMPGYCETSIISRDGVPQIAVEQLQDGVKRNVIFGEWRM